MFCECGLPRMVLQREACIGDSNQSRETKKALTNKVASHGSASLKTDSTLLGLVASKYHSLTSVALKTRFHLGRRV